VGGACLESVSARAVNLRRLVCGVNPWLWHDLKIPFLQSTQCILDSVWWQSDSKWGSGSVWAQSTFPEVHGLARRRAICATLVERK
jgi:hypothetical protein